MASEIRVNTINNRSGLGTITISDSGAVFAGITTIGSVTIDGGTVTTSGTVTAGSFSGDGSALTGVASTDNIRTNTNATFLQNVNISGVTTVSAGSASAPSITATGDLDTGIFFPAADTIGFAEGGSERARIDSSGHLIVGGTTAGNAATRTVSIGSPGTTTGGLQLWSTTSGQHFIQFGDGTGSASDHYRGLIGYEHNNDALIFYTASSERARILSGGGITFNGDTAAANALDDYEEGTWTPTFSNGGTLTYTVQLGRYTKIGNIVHATCHLDVATKGTASGNLRVTGLPFSAINVTNYYGISSTIHGTNWSTARRSINGLLSYNSTNVDFYHNMVGTTQSSNPSITGSDWGFVSHDDIDTGNLLFTVTYQTA